MKAQVVVFLACLALGACHHKADGNTDHHNDLSINLNNVQSLCSDKSDGTTLPHPTDCNKFIICFSGTDYVQSCKDGYCYNPILQHCERDSGIKRVAVEYSLTRSVDDDLEEACKGKPNGALVPHPQSCSKFLYCLSPPVVRDCPAGLHFNPKLKVCDWPASAGCTSESSKPSKMPKINCPPGQCFDENRGFCVICKK